MQTYINDGAAITSAPNAPFTALPNASQTLSSPPEVALVAVIGLASDGVLNILIVILPFATSSGAVITCVPNASRDRSSEDARGMKKLVKAV